MAEVLSHCFLSERFKKNFEASKLKFRMVREKISAFEAGAILAAVDPCIMSGRDSEVRAPIHFTPSPGRVVMCDFSFLRAPEMQKERRAIVVARKTHPGRCVVVPVSKSEKNAGNANYYQFAPASYAFFHASEPVWAICDHPYTVALTRLWQVNIDRKPSIPAISDDHFDKVRGLVASLLTGQPLTTASAA